MIDADAFEACFAAWAASQATSLDGEVVAIDGKTVRRSFDSGRDQSPLQGVSAWASDQALVLARRAVDPGSNETAAIPDVLDALELEGALVTLDAMGTQKEIAQHIRDCKAHYLLVLKANHEAAYEASAYEAVEAHFEQQLRMGSKRKWQSNAAPLRCLRRLPRLFGAPARLFQEAVQLEALGQWLGLRSVLAVENIRSVKGKPGGKAGVTAQIRYFLCSARNWTVLRKIALNLLKGDAKTRSSVRGRRKKASWDEAYMAGLLTGSFMR